jgi:RimJ/RimL family protein N-acetyltransferase
MPIGDDEMIPMIRPLGVEEIPAISQQIAADQVAMKWIAHYSNPDAWLKNYAEKQITLGYEEDGKLIGFTNLDVVAREVYLTYNVFPEYRGKKYGTNMLKDVIEWVRAHHPRRVILAFVETENTGSQKCLDRANFLDRGITQGFNVYSYVV